MKMDNDKKVKLDYHSERFAKRLFKRFPQWRQYAGYFPKGTEDDFVNYLDVKIPPVNPNVLEPLSIITFPYQEIIVSWIGGSHIHLGKNDIHKDFDYIEHAIEFLEAVASDQIVFGYYDQNGKNMGGFVAGVASDALSRLSKHKGCSTIIRSWFGGHDADIGEER